MSSSEQTVIIKRKRGHHGAGHHGGAWKIAYADFMTAMMAFFLVMWLLSIVPKKELQDVALYFRTPLISAIKGDRPQSPVKSVIPGGDPSPIPNEAPKPTDMDPQAQLDREDTERLEDLKSRLESLIDKSPTLHKFRPQLILDMTPEGLRIQIVDSHNRPMFATGSAVMQSYMRQILSELGPVLNEMPNGISISGHTDSVQYANGERLYSNWELSADRANNARQQLVASGLDSVKMRRIQGLASIVGLDKDPLAAINRRISIVVMNRRAERSLMSLGNSPLISASEARSASDPAVVHIAQPVAAEPSVQFESLHPETEGDVRYLQELTREDKRDAQTAHESQVGAP